MTKTKSRPIRCVIWILFISVIMVIIGWGAYIGRNVPFSEQQPLYSMLQTVSGIMFSVFGLWIALLYPDLRRKVFSVDGKQLEADKEKIVKAHPYDEAQQADHILEPFFVSLFVLLLTVVFHVCAPVVKRLAFLAPWTGPIRGASYGIIGLLTFLEITTIIRAMRVTDGLKAVIGKGKIMGQVKLRIRQNREEQKSKISGNKIDGQEGSEEN